MIFSLVSITSGYSFINCETDFRCCTDMVGVTIAVPTGPNVSDVITAPMSPMERKTPPSAIFGIKNFIKEFRFNNNKMLYYNVSVEDAF